MSDGEKYLKGRKSETLSKKDAHKKLKNTYHQIG